MVAVESKATGAAAGRALGRQVGDRVWVAGAAAVLLVGLVVRLALGGGGVGDRSAAVLAALLAISGWAAAAVLGSPRSAFVVCAALVVLFDLAALAPRGEPVYDDRAALYRSDQVIEIDLPAGGAGGAGGSMLALLVEPVFAGEQAPFGLAGEVGGAQVNWACAFRHGMQTIALPLPEGVAGGGSLKATLHMTGSVSREGSYLLVYSSSKQGGVVSRLIPDAPQVGAEATVCTPV